MSCSASPGGMLCRQSACRAATWRWMSTATRHRHNSVSVLISFVTPAPDCAARWCLLSRGCGARDVQLCPRQYRPPDHNSQCRCGVTGPVLMQCSCDAIVVSETASFRLRPTILSPVQQQQGILADGKATVDDTANGERQRASCLLQAC